MLTYPDLNREFELYTDASEIALGAILKQGKAVCGIFSYKMKGAEINYTILEKETLCIYKAMEHFKPILFSAKTNIFTDCKNCIENSDLSKRSNRWKLLLEQFNYTLRHVEGKQNKLADTISRLNICSTRYHKTSKSPLNIDEINRLHIKHPPDKKIQTQTAHIYGYSWKVNTKKKIIINHEITNKVIQIIHESLIHPGFLKMYTFCQEFFKIYNLKESLKNCLNLCRTCNLSKMKQNKLGKVKQTVWGNHPNELVAIDIKGPIKTQFFQTKINHKQFYLVVMIDTYTRFTETKLIWSISSEEIVKAFVEEWINKHNKPKRIISDRGRQFISNKFAQMCENYAIKHTMTSCYSPTSNSIVERANGQIGEVLRISKGKTLNEVVKSIHTRLNLTNHKSTGYAPINLFKNINIFGERVIVDSAMQKEIREKLLKNQISNSEKDYKKRKEFNFEISKRAYRKIHCQDKIEDKWAGPFEIIKVNESQITSEKITKSVFKTSEI